MYVLLCLQLWGTTTSFILQGTLKLHAHLLVLLLRLAGLDELTHTYCLLPRLISASCVHCLLQFSSHSSLTLINECFLSRILYRACLPLLMSCRSYMYVSSVRTTTRLLSLTDSHVIDAWVHMPPEMFCPYSLLSGTSTGTTNRTSSLVYLWYSTKPYAPVALTRTLHLVSSAPESHLYSSRTRKLRHLPQ